MILTNPFLESMSASPTAFLCFGMMHRFKMKMSSGKSLNSATNILVFTAEYNNPQSSPKIENPKVVKWNFCETLCKIQDTVQKGEWHSYTNLKRKLARYLEQTQLEKHCNSRESSTPLCRSSQGQVERKRQRNCGRSHTMDDGRVVLSQRHMRNGARS